MKWKLLLTVTAVAGSVVWAARRRVNQEAEDAARWAEATDSVSS